MEPLDVAALYYDAWKNKKGDMTGVPLAEDFSYTGPVASFDDAAGFRAMAANAGSLVTGFAIRHQAAVGDVVLTVVDMEMSLPIPTVTSAEILDRGRLVRGENIYDAEPMRQAMAQAPAEA
jgi:SnoaL-like protein